jgi:SprA family protein
MINSTHPLPIRSNYSTELFRNAENDSNKDQVNPVKEVNNAEGIEKNNKQDNNRNDAIKRSENELNQQELKQLRDLRRRDREVRAHEQAHAAAAGALAKSGPSYQYQRGPDGQLYAVGGEVQIDTSAVSGNPEATAQRARQIQRAALAPAQPSQQDRAVASAAAAMEAQARIEIAQQKFAERNENITETVTDKKDSQESDNIKKTVSIEEQKIQTTCAECGGQHSDKSHATATSIENKFNELTINNFSSNLLNIAI